MRLEQWLLLAVRTLLVVLVVLALAQPFLEHLGLTFVPVTLIATTNIGAADAGLASGLFNTSQQIGGALGLAVLSTVAASATKNAHGARPDALKTVSTVVAGLFLSLSFVLAGLVLVRSRRRVAGRAVAAVLVCVVTAAAAAVAAYANAAPPVGWRAQDPGDLLKIAPDGRAREGHVRVEVVEEGYDIILLVPEKKWKGDEEE